MSDSTSPRPSPPPPVRRIITGHSPTGKAIVLRDEIQTPRYWAPGGINGIYDIHRTNEHPARIDSEIAEDGSGEWVDEIARGEEKGFAGLKSKNGSMMRVYDYSPGYAVPMHRTISMDYGICMKGSVILTLDDGKEVTMNEGDIVVQRGTVHAWRNASNTEWARLAFVVLDAIPAMVNGQPLEQKAI